MRTLREVVEEAQKNHITAVLAANDRVKEAASILGISGGGLWYYKKKFKIATRPKKPNGIKT